MDDSGGLVRRDAPDELVSLSGWAWFAEMRAAVPEAVIDEYLYASDELILHGVVGDLLNFGIQALEVGHLEVVSRLLAVMERGLLHGDAYVEESVAVSFVQEAWLKGRDSFIGTWPQSLLDEMNRQRVASAWPTTILRFAGSGDVLSYSQPRADLPRPPLQRLRSDGTLVWAMLPPESEDSWVSASVDRLAVTANSWSCWRVTIDLESGREMGRAFTK